MTGVDGSRPAAGPSGGSSSSGHAAARRWWTSTRSPAGAEITFDARAEVWLVDDPALVAAVRASLRERGDRRDRRTPLRRRSGRRTTTRSPPGASRSAPWSGRPSLLIALLVLLVLAVTGWRDRARDLAVLRLNGAGARTTRRLAVVGPAAGRAARRRRRRRARAGRRRAGDARRRVLPGAAGRSRSSTPATSWPAVLARRRGLRSSCCPAAAALAGRAVARRAHLERVRETG